MAVITVVKNQGLGFLCKGLFLTFFVCGLVPGQRWAGHFGDWVAGCSCRFEDAGLPAWPAQRAGPPRSCCDKDHGVLHLGALPNPLRARFPNLSGALHGMEGGAVHTEGSPQKEKWLAGGGPRSSSGLGPQQVYWPFFLPQFPTVVWTLH